MVFRPTIMERNFDSVLHPAQSGRPAQLVIRLRVNLLPYDPSRLARASRPPRCRLPATLRACARALFRI